MLNLPQWCFTQEVQVVFKGHNLELHSVLLQSNIKCPIMFIFKVMENSSPNAAVMPNHPNWGQRNFQLHQSNVRGVEGEKSWEVQTRVRNAYESWNEDESLV